MIVHECSPIGKEKAALRARKSGICGAEAQRLIIRRWTQPRLQGLKGNRRHLEYVKVIDEPSVEELGQGIRNKIAEVERGKTSGVRLTLS